MDSRSVDEAGTSYVLEETFATDESLAEFERTLADEGLPGIKAMIADL